MAEHWRDGRLVFRVALVVGLAVRLVVLSQTASLGTPIVDEQHYTALAGSLLEGDGFARGPGQLTSIRPPLYPAFLAAVWQVTGPDSFQAVRFVQIALALVTTGLVFLLGRRVFDAGVGRFAAAVYWLYPSLIFFNFTILTETLFTFLLIAFVLLAVVLVESPKAWIALACGAVLGMAALTRSVMWPVPFVFGPLLAVMIRGPVRVRVAIPLLVFGGYLVVVGPWAVRNTRLQGVATVVDTMGGVNMRLGNYEHTPDDRMWAAIDELTGDKEWSYELDQANPGKVFTEGQKEKWAQAKAVEYILAHPATFARRALIRFGDLWGIEREFIAGVQHGMFAPPTWFAVLAAAAIVGGYVAVVLVGAAGLWLSPPPNWRANVLVLFPIVLLIAVHGITFGHSRYHMPVMPLLGVYASALIIRHAPRLRGPRGFAWFGAAATVLVLVAFWVRQFVITDAERIRSLFT